MSEKASEQIDAQAPVDQGVGKEGLALDGGKTKKTLDPGAKKNLMIIGGAVGLAIVVMGVMFISMSPEPTVSERGLPGTRIATPPATAQPTGELSPEELARLDRVATREAEQAATQGQTFVPAEIPLIQQQPPMPMPMPMPMPPPPGMNYHVGTGATTQGQSQADVERMQRTMQGFQQQMARIAEANAVPATFSAPRYVGLAPGGGAQAAAVTAAPTATPTATPTAVAPILIGALSIFAAETITTINTERTAFVSARMVTGPASGATLFGTSEMVSDQGVRVSFNRMLLDGQSYTINAIALDPADSHDLLNADVDRKRFERYVLPILGSMGSAYFSSRARQATRVVAGPSVESVAVEQREPTSRQSTAEALAAGLATATQQIANNQPVQPSATLQAGASIGVLFLDQVLARSGPGGATPQAALQQTSLRN